MENEPLESAFLLKCMMDHVPDMIYFKDCDSKFIMMNKAAADWQGLDSPEDVVGHSDLETYSAEDAQRMRDDELQIMETGVPLMVEEPETKKDGSKAWVSTTKVPLRNENNEIVGIFGISRDITLHKEAEIRETQYAEANARFREEIEDDLRLASQLQKTFFPTSYPEFGNRGHEPVDFFHFHEAGGMIGGDLCSIRKLSETEAGIFLCDVMGHGVRAALGTSIVRAVVEEISHQRKDPGRFLKHMNQVLSPLFRQDDLFIFASACYMVIDVVTGRMRVANAGHPKPICLDASTGAARELTDILPGPALAVSADASYETAVFQLNAGDGVFMYTDGITEVTNPEGEEFGEERLRASARSASNMPNPELFPVIYADACSFSADGTVEDDVCLVGFRLSSFK